MEQFTTVVHKWKLSLDYSQARGKVVFFFLLWKKMTERSKNARAPKHWPQTTDWLTDWWRGDVFSLDTRNRMEFFKTETLSTMDSLQWTILCLQQLPLHWHQPHTNLKTWQEQKKREAPVFSTQRREHSTVFWRAFAASLLWSFKNAPYY